MAINLEEKASPKVVERFKIGSVTEGLFSNDYSWTGVATVRVHSIDTIPLADYGWPADLTPADITLSGSRFGTLHEIGDTVQEMTVAQDKCFNGVIDKRNNTSVLMMKAASKVLKRETDEVLIPYVDKYRLGALGTALTAAITAGHAAASQEGGTTALTSSNIIEKIMEANAVMSDLLVPTEGRVLYMSYATAVKLKLADQVVGIDKLGEKAIVNGAMGRVDQCQVRLVPTAYMTAAGATNGFIIIKKGVALAPKKIETFRIIETDKDVDGSIVQGRLLHDCFLLNAKAHGLYRYAGAA